MYMTHLIFESSAHLSKSEVSDWFSSFGFTVYNVRPKLDGADEDGKPSRFIFTTTDQAARHALEKLQGKSIEGHAVTISLHNGN